MYSFRAQMRCDIKVGYRYKFVSYPLFFISSIAIYFVLYFFSDNVYKTIGSSNLIYIMYDIIIHQVSLSIKQLIIETVIHNLDEAFTLFVTPCYAHIEFIKVLVHYVVIPMRFVSFTKLLMNVVTSVAANELCTSVFTPNGP